MSLNRIVEYVFFFSLLLASGYMVWLISAPFISALALAAIVVTIFHPLHRAILAVVTEKYKSFAAFISTILILILIIIPVFFVSSMVIKEIVGFYKSFDTESVTVNNLISNLESSIEPLLGGVDINLNGQIKNTMQAFTGNIGSIFASTISTVFISFISIISSFYFFRDGKEFLKIIIKVSPLPDDEDRIIFNRLARSVRSVVTGTVLVALIQGILVSLGFFIFGINRAILWGSMAAVGALIPGIGTTIVTVPAIIYLFITSSLGDALGLLLWSMTLVGLIDNLIGPYLMSRGNDLHPFLVLISVLGGISLFGPIVGFILGPVIVTLFIVLLEIYNQYTVKNVLNNKERETKTKTKTKTSGVRKRIGVVKSK